MPKTGYSFIDTFSEICIFFPLLPVLLIFIKRTHQSEALNFLMILCLLNFIRGLLLFTPEITSVSSNTISKVFNLTELTILSLLFLTTIKEKLRYFLGLFFVALLSSTITLYLLKENAENLTGIEILQESFLALVAVWGLISLVSKNDLQIFHSSLFWIVIGTIFYFFISLLVKIYSESGKGIHLAANEDSIVLLNIACFFRYTFYLFAVLVYRQRLPENNTFD